MTTDGMTSGNTPSEPTGLAGDVVSNSQIRRLAHQAPHETAAEIIRLRAALAAAHREREEARKEFAGYKGAHEHCVEDRDAIVTRLRARGERLEAVWAKADALCGAFDISPSGSPALPYNGRDDHPKAIEEARLIENFLFACADYRASLLGDGGAREEEAGG